jgi:hypothetical protein
MAGQSMDPSGTRATRRSLGLALVWSEWAFRAACAHSRVPRGWLGAAPGGVRLQVLPDQALGLGQQHAAPGGDAELQALGDALYAVDEVRCGGVRADLACRALKQLQPTIEVARVDRQGQVLFHGLAMIPARHQGDRRLSSHNLSLARIRKRSHAGRPPLLGLACGDRGLTLR